MRLDELFKKRAKDHEIKQMAQTIRNDCQYYLSAVGQVNLNTTLFRGMNERKIFLKKQVRKNRKSVNMPEDIKQIVDTWFEQKFGTPFRSSSVFATSNYHDANQYGRVYAIFPIGQFQFVWSPTLRDFFNDNVWKKMEKYSFEQKQHYVANFLENQTKYTNADLKKGIASGHEVMIAADAYYAVRISEEWTKLVNTLNESHTFNVMDPRKALAQHT